jgi:hypothetical protein
MAFSGTVKNGIVVLPPEGHRAANGDKDSGPAQLGPGDAPFIDAVLKLAKPRPHWPVDFVLNHGHYVSGEPKKS